MAERGDRWAFAEFTDVYEMQSDFEARLEKEFNAMLERAAGKSGARS